MTNSRQNATPPTVKAILEAAILSGIVTPKGIAIAAESDHDMVARVLAGQPMKLHPFRRLTGNQMFPQSVRDQLADWFGRGTGYQWSRADECDRAKLDADGDGVVDANDVAAHAVCSIRKATDAVSAVVAASKGAMSEAGRAQVSAELYEARIKLELAIEAMNYRGPRLGRVG